MLGVSFLATCDLCRTVGVATVTRSICLTNDGRCVLERIVSSKITHENAVGACMSSANLAA